MAMKPGSADCDLSVYTHTHTHRNHPSIHPSKHSSAMRKYSEQFMTFSKVSGYISGFGFSAKNHKQVPRREAADLKIPHLQ